MKRTIYLKLIARKFELHPICALLGPRQVGKTTLARQFIQEYNFSENVEFLDLENPNDLAQLTNPMLTLSRYAGKLVVIDEIQRKPELFPILRVLVDDPDKKYQFLILGSASQELIRQSSETLAGRIGYIQLPPFTFFDLLENNEQNNVEKLLIQGGYPKSYLAKNEQDSFEWRQDYIQMFLERDLLSFGIEISPQLMHKFWMMLCFYHGQMYNNSQISSALMISDKTTTRYLHILQGTFMIRILQPWHENIKKRQVKTPKIYFKDAGIFNCLSSIHSLQQLFKNPQIGALWEGFAVEQVINCFQIRDEDCYFWSTSNEAELDLLVFKNGKRIGFEFKYTDFPSMTRSMSIALQDLKLDHIYLIYPGQKIFPLHEQITAVGFHQLSHITL